MRLGYIHCSLVYSNQNAAVSVRVKATIMRRLVLRDTCEFFN